MLAFVGFVKVIVLALITKIKVRTHLCLELKYMLQSVCFLIKLGPPLQMTGNVTISLLTAKCL